MRFSVLLICVALLAGCATNKPNPENNNNTFEYSMKPYDEIAHEDCKEIEEYLSKTNGVELLQSEAFDIWVLATRGCRAEISRLERLIKFKDEQEKKVNTAKPQMQELSGGARPI